jgi:hypothetical protein
MIVMTMRVMMMKVMMRWRGVEEMWKWGTCHEDDVDNGKGEDQESDVDLID